ncbi:peptide-N4-(N-acetyl-beta- glucosaminyl)asparagine amidase [Gryganskiella cystojenkinii]|nr:peptide-N4-(N-acetyl-beta- glucosaminyl)asparagine amidase [Gryganskiella cystojenkinii]
MDNQSNQGKDAQHVQELARQLASQFSTMRGRGSNSIPASTLTGPTNAQTGSGDNASEATAQINTSEVQALANQLGMLLSKTNVAVTSPSIPTPFKDVPDPSIYEKDFADTFYQVNAAVLKYEDRVFLDMATEQMDVSRLFEEAEAMAKDFPEDSTDDIGKTISIGGTAPSAQERLDGAGVVETYRCAQSCPDITRFPRYGGMSKILFETRRGRCGEWANVCYSARFVHDTTDHVWTEVWSEHKKRWIHCDSCEAAYDQPLLYTTGWGKSLSYCVAFSDRTMIDAKFQKHERNEFERCPEMIL